MEDIKAVLAVNLVGTLATINEDGSPWATPVHVIAGENEVYWYSKDTHQHSQNIIRNPKVSLSLWARIEATKGVYLQGTATRLEGDLAEQAFAYIRKPDGSLPSVFENTSPYVLPIGQFNRDKSSENRWYFYS